MKITIPEFSLVALIGASGSGKSSFARRHFSPTEVLSSDACRGLISDNENDQSVTKDAFELLHYIASKRLRRALLTVVDATNVQPEARQPLVELAREQHVLPVAIVLNVPEKICHERNAARADRDFGAHVVRNQTQQLRRSLRALGREGFRHVFVLSSVEEIEAVSIERQPLWNNLKHERGAFDIIGDVHGCFDELRELLETLGYEIEKVECDTTTDEKLNQAFINPADKTRGDVIDESNGLESFELRKEVNRVFDSSHDFNVTPPANRKAVFVGDLVDRGENSPDVLRLVMRMVAEGKAFCVPGNHDIKLLKKLNNRNVQITHGLAETLAQLERESSAFRERVKKFLDKLISHYVFDDGRLVVAHAGLPENMQGRGSGRVRDFCLYGETTGETDEFGLPVRYNWAADYRGRATVVYGHTPVPEAAWLNNTINLDTGCVFGGKLTALRYPKRSLSACRHAKFITRA